MKKLFKHKFLPAIFAITLLLFAPETWAQTVVVTYTTPGTGSVNVPTNAYNIIGKAWGGGGGGGAAYGSCGATAKAGGGGGGAYAIKTYSSSGGYVFGISVGKGTGAASSNLSGINNGDDGEESSCSYNGVTIKANGGKGGKQRENHCGVGPSSSDGGNGGVPENGDAGSEPGTKGLSGADGGNGGGAPYGGSSTGSPNNDSDGIPGNAPGGGGSGGRANEGGFFTSLSYHEGGAGAAGQVIVSFNIAAPSLTIAQVCEGGSATFIINNYESTGVVYELYKGTTPKGTFSSSVLTLSSVALADAGDDYYVQATYTITKAGGTLSATGFDNTDIPNNKVMLKSANKSLEVVPKPVISAQTTTVCTGGNLNFQASALTNVTSFTWSAPTYGSNITGSALAGGSGTAIPGTLSNSGSSDQTVVYTVTPYNGTCAGNPFTLTVTVEAYPNITTSFTSTICSGEAFTVIPVDGTDGIVPANTTYTWAAPIGNDFGATTEVNKQTSISQTLTNTGTSNASVTYMVTAHRNNPTCPLQTNTFSVTVTIKPNPDIGEQFATVCTGHNLNYEASTLTNVTSFTWTTASVGANITGISAGATGSGSAITGTLYNNTSGDQEVVYTVTPYNGTCAGADFTLTVSVQTYPDILHDFTPTICSGEAFTVKPEAGTDGIVTTSTRYIWTVPTNSLGATSVSDIQEEISQTLTNNSTSNASVTYSVTARRTSGNTQCMAQTDNFDITVTVKPQLSISGGAPSVEEGGTLNFTGAPTGGAWASTNTTVATIDNSGLLTANQPGHTTVKYTLDGCEVTKDVYVLPNSETKRLCLGEQEVFDAGLPGSWSVTGTTGIISLQDNGDGTCNITAAGVGSTEITFDYVLGIPDRTFPVIVPQEPTVAALSTITAICAGEQLNETEPTHAFYNSALFYEKWFLSSATDLTADVDSITMPHTVAYADNGKKLNFIARNECGQIIQSEIVAVKQLPVLHNYNTTICSGETAYLSAPHADDVIPTGTTLYKWDRDSYAGITGHALPTDLANGDATFTQGPLINTTNEPKTAKYISVVATTEGCSSEKVAYEVTVNPKPTIGDKTATRCSGSEFTLTTGGTDIVPAGTLYSWTISIPNSNIGGATTGTTETEMKQTLTNNTQTNQTIVYTVTPVAPASPSNCTGANFTVTLTVHPTPAVTLDLPPNNDVCEGVGCKLSLTGVPSFTLDYTVSKNGGPDESPASFGLGSVFDAGLTKTGDVYTIDIPAGAFGTFTFKLSKIMDGRGCVATP